MVHERAEDLVRQLTILYGAGIERILTILDERGALSPPTLRALVDDELVSSLLLVHGLHPDDVETRVAAALDSVRPYLGSHGGDVELLGVSESGAVSLRLLGSCDGCPSSSVTLKLAVEDAIEAAAPEVISIEVEEQAGGEGGSTLISIDSLRARLGEEAEDSVGTWTPVPELADLAAGQVAGYTAGGMDVVGCRIGSDVFMFRDRCGRCSTSLAGSTLARPVGAAVGTGVLTCPSCHSHFDVRRAGVCSEDETLHLDPLPVLVRSGVLSVAIPTVSAAS
ncbi:MAG: NifU family protein [Actinomycetota bacterium]|nr:NifU family protein [Actinomycetota bacterium]